MEKKILIEGMHCASCVSLNTQTLQSLDGVDEVNINLATKQANISYDDSKIDFDAIQEAIKKNGFQPIDIEASTHIQTQKNPYLSRFLWSVWLSLPVFSMMFGNFMTWVEIFWVDLMMYIYAILSFIVVFILWFHFHRNAVTAFKRGNFNMDTLVSLWTSVAFIYSVIAMFVPGGHVYFEAAVAIITLINLGRYLEYKAKTRAWDAIWKLLELWAKQARVLVDTTPVETDIDAVNIGDTIIVKPWEKIPLDGVVIEWWANCDESMLTWESVPVYKTLWDSCYGGTINTDGNLHIQVTKGNDEGTLAKIIELVDRAQSSKAPIQHLVDRISWIFVPIILIISWVTFGVWYIITGDISQAIVPAVASLVIACPCALGLATPTAIMVGTGVGAKQGILIKDASTLEKTKDIDVVVFDKTGTLTNAQPEVTDIIPVQIDESELIDIAKTLAEKSHHPLSQAITDYQETHKKYSTKQIQDFEEIQWKGITAVFWDTQIYLGNKKLFSKISDDIENSLESLTKQWKTPIIIWEHEKIYGILWLLDLPKPWVEQTIDMLHSLDIEVIMLTGDTRNTAQYIGDAIGIDTIYAEVMPEDKLTVIEELQQSGKRVAFVGDGINDAPALVQADLSIAMGTGSDIAIESSDIVLVWGNLDKVVSAIGLSRKTLSTIKQNLFWAFIYNSIGIPLAALGLLNPIFASFAMSMSSVSVISNSLRLKFFHK